MQSAVAVVVLICLSITPSVEPAAPCTVTSATSYAATGSVITCAGAMTISGPLTITGRKALVIEASSIEVTSSGSITALGNGYCARTGHYGSYTAGATLHGGSHGGTGAGAVASADDVTGPHGSYLAPTHLGNGGDYKSGHAGCGGGAIHLKTTGTMTINGVIEASGENGKQSSRKNVAVLLVV